mmetsp:Transcript_6771/g.16609  ORF Transcript_6771/g.16609 Transcript_6771/m.16609 type:complete len:252 (+) Transcript_6771:836-1591(+)
MTQMSHLAEHIPSSLLTMWLPLSSSRTTCSPPNGTNVLKTGFLCPLGGACFSSSSSWRPLPFPFLPARAPFFARSFGGVHGASTLLFLLACAPPRWSPLDRSGRFDLLDRCEAASDSFFFPSFLITFSAFWMNERQLPSFLLAMITRLGLRFFFGAEPELLGESSSRFSESVVEQVPRLSPLKTRRCWSGGIPSCPCSLALVVSKLGESRSIIISLRKRLLVARRGIHNMVLLLLFFFWFWWLVGPQPLPL